MDAGKPLDFQMRLLVMKGDTLAAYEHVARALYGFRDYRRNDLCSLNQTFENTVDYAMSEYAHFNDELRGSNTQDSRAAEILELIRNLPEAYRETLVLRLVEGMTGPEIASRTGLTAASVRVNLHRGMKLLREQLGFTEGL